MRLKISFKRTLRPIPAVPAARWWIPKAAWWVVFKVGAEGYLLAFLQKDGLGVSLKVADGNQRARTVALLAILRGIGLLSESEARELEAIAKPVVRNSRNEVVGHIEAPAGLACFQGKAGLRPFNRA